MNIPSNPAVFEAVRNMGIKAYEWIQINFPTIIMPEYSYGNLDTIGFAIYLCKQEKYDLLLSKFGKPFCMALMEYLIENEAYEMCAFLKHSLTEKQPA